MRSPALGRFWRLLEAEPPTHVFNPWTQRDPGTDAAKDAPQARLERLRAHLAAPIRVILLGEAPGYQGCHVSGIPFTSERLILAGQIPRVTSEGRRLSTRHIPWSEPSATTVWGTLQELGIADCTALWNAYPWHPHQPGNRQSNRTPTREERLVGVPVLKALLAAFPQATVFAVGRTAEASLREVGCEAKPLRHPSMGGAKLFRGQLRDALA